MVRIATSVFCFAGAAFTIAGNLFLAYTTSFNQSEKAPKTAFKFAFGTGNAAPGYTLITPDMTYTKERGFGFDFGSKVEGINRGGNDSLRGQLVTSNTPFYYSVDVPEGNYDITVILGDPHHHPGRDAPAHGPCPAYRKRQVRHAHLYDQRSQLFPS
jgi:hypothetical protein